MGGGALFSVKELTESFFPSYPNLRPNMLCWQIFSTGYPQQKDSYGLGAVHSWCCVGYIPVGSGNIPGGNVENIKSL